MWYQRLKHIHSSQTHIHCVDNRQHPKSSSYKISIIKCYDDTLNLFHKKVGFVSKPFWALNNPSGCGVANAPPSQLANTLDITKKKANAKLFRRKSV